MGLSIWLSPSGLTRMRASSLSISPSFTMSTAILNSANEVRLPVLVWSIQSFPRWMVNSTSCISLKWRSRIERISKSCPYTSGISSSREGTEGSVFEALLMGRGVLVPATTSSPWAFRRYSPKKTFSPVEGFLVKATPVPESVPMLPKTMLWTLTAVPQEAGMSFILLYASALALFQDLKTAPMAPHNCSTGSSGNSTSSFALMSALNDETRSFRSSTVKSMSSVMPLAFFFSSMSASKGSSSCLLWGLSPSTTSPYMATKRRKQSQANHSFPVNSASPFTVRAFSPRLRTVSIMPGMLALAPDLMESRSGFLGSPNFMPISSSTRFRLARTSSVSPSGNFIPC